VILDSSAIIAVLVREPGWNSVAAKIGGEPTIGVGAPTLAETGIVLSRKLGRQGRTVLSRFLQQTNAIVIPFGEDHWRVAIDAYLRFGKRRHPAALNLGDCLTYATARLAEQPLLCLGDDFAKTDLTIA
jgi:ribonuclease VapC